MRALACRGMGRRSPVWAAAVGWVAVVGCGRPSAPIDAPMARQALATALESWQAGDLPAKIRESLPAITMVDPEWEIGQKLERFEIVGPEVDTGRNLICPVKLVFKVERGTETASQVKYVVGTSPVITIFRERSRF
ncbi:MAG TPA: hypothetical protein VGX76_13675 [Pirellulales bacterium]|nr:hypothetical protein [Pirellulales bacterium]